MNRGALKIIGFGLAVLLATGVYAGLRERAEQKSTMRSLLDSIATMKLIDAAYLAAGLPLRGSQSGGD